MKGKKVITPKLGKKIIALRKKKNGAPAIAKKLGISQAPVGKYLKKAIEEGIISRLEYNLVLPVDLWGLTKPALS